MNDYVPNDQERQLEVIRELKTQFEDLITNYVNPKQTNIPEAYSLLLGKKEILQAKITAYNKKYDPNLLDTSEDKCIKAVAQVVERVEKAQAARAAAKATKNGYQGVLRL